MQDSENVEQVLSRITDYFNRHFQRLQFDLFNQKQLLLFDEKSSCAVLLKIDKNSKVKTTTYVAEVIPFFPEIKTNKEV